MARRKAGSQQTRTTADTPGAGKKRRAGKSAGREAHGYPGADGWQLFAAEAAYADSMVKSALGDGVGCLAALRQSLEALPTYAPAILSLGSVEYQRRRAHHRGRDARDTERRQIIRRPSMAHRRIQQGHEKDDACQ